MRHKKPKANQDGKLHLDCYLILSESGGVHAVRKRPALKAGEVAIHLDLFLPPDYFVQMIPTASLDIEPEHIHQPEMKIVMTHAFKKL